MYISVFTHMLNVNLPSKSRSSVRPLVDTNTMWHGVFPLATEAGTWNLNHATSGYPSGSTINHGQ